MALASAAGIPPGRQHVDKVSHQVMSRLPFVWDDDIDEPAFRADAQDAGLAEPALAGDGFHLPLSAAPDAWRWAGCKRRVIHRRDCIVDAA
jgi:hypothetical protein